MNGEIVGLINMVLFAFLIVTAFAIVRTVNLFAVVMLSSVFSLLSAALFMALDAPDVAFTEAAVGAGASTVLMLGTMALTRRTESKLFDSTWPALLVVAATGAALVYGTIDLPPFGTASAPINQHLAPDYIAMMDDKMGFPNIVTAILASWRGYDTMGEVVVVFVAAIAVLLMLLDHGHTRREAERLEQTEKKDAA